MAEEPKTVYLLYFDERHYGRSYYGVTTRLEWAESWAERNQSLIHAPSMEEVSFDEMILDDPEVFPEAKAELEGAGEEEKGEQEVG